MIPMPASQNSGRSGPGQTLPTTPFLSVVMPVHNEQDTVQRSLDRVIAVPIVSEVLVVDDGSTDGTAEILQQVQDPRVRVLRLEQCSGKGSAIRAAIPHLRGELVVIQDADLEYDPQQLPALAERMYRDGLSAVYGSRFQGQIEGMRLLNWLGNRLLTVAVNLLYGTHLTDEATCYKMFRTELLQSIPLTCRRFEFCPEVTAKVLRRGLRIAEVPIHYEARGYAAGKKIRARDFFSALWTLIRYRFKS